MKRAAETMNLSFDSFRGYDNQSDFQNSSSFNLFGMEFSSDFSGDLDGMLRNLSVLILYNQTYLD